MATSSNTADGRYGVTVRSDSISAARVPPAGVPAYYLGRPAHPARPSTKEKRTARPATRTATTRCPEAWWPKHAAAEAIDRRHADRQRDCATAGRARLPGRWPPWTPPAAGDRASAATTGGGGAGAGDVAPLAWPGPTMLWSVTVRLRCLGSCPCRVRHPVVAGAGHRSRLGCRR